MKVKFIHIALCILLIASTYAYAGNESLECFTRVANVKLPFEIYNVADCKKYIQHRGSSYGLSIEGVPFIDCADELTTAPLCNGNFVAVWKFSHHRLPISLTGRVFDLRGQTVQNDFPISHENEMDEWEHSVGTLYNGGFIITWKTWKTTARKEIKLRGRIFDMLGKPKGKSFDIYSPGNNNGAFVYGLPNGGFVVVWNHDYQGAFLRIFDDRGKPKTKAILIAPENRSRTLEPKIKGVEIAPEKEDCPLKPRAHITSKGNINVFMTCQSKTFDGNSFFIFARGFDEIGTPLSNVLSGKDIQSLEGYGSLIEQYIKEEAQIYDLRLRDFKSNFKGRQYCHGFLLSPHTANDMKNLTTDQSMKNFFTAYCADYRKYCIVQNYEEPFLSQCMRR